MISAQTSARQYQQAQFATVDRGQLLLMMFDGGERFLGQAEQHLAGGDVPGFLHALGRAQAVIAELLATLDHQRGGEIARNLDRLYRFMLDHLIEANVAKSSRHVGQVRRILGIIGGAYREVLRNGMPQVDVA
jgi:flagellar secretion chaperone FliS